MQRRSILSSTRHVKSGVNPRRPLRKAKHVWRPIVNKYREGKVGSTPMRGVAVPETVHLQAVGGLWPLVKPDGVPLGE